MTALLDGRRVDLPCVIALLDGRRVDLPCVIALLDGLCDCLAGCPV